MANEAVTIELLGDLGDPVQFTVANGLGVTKGTLLTLVDPRTVSAAYLVATRFAGIAAMDKVAGDGSTRLSAYTRGVFDLTASTEAITAGDLVMISGANLIKKATFSDVVSGAVIGKALEDASSGEVIAVMVGCM